MHWIRKGLGFLFMVAAARKAQSIAVTVARVEPRDVQRRVPVVGTLFDFDEIEISAKQSGRIVRITHDIGDVVQPGETLLQIDDTDDRRAAPPAPAAVPMSGGSKASPA